MSTHNQAESVALTDEEIDLVTAPLRNAVQQGADGRWLVDGPLINVVDALGEAADRIARERAAQAWDEAILHVENFVGRVTKRAAIRDNPYREEASRG